jgi:hypothetical protein
VVENTPIDYSRPIVLAQRVQTSATVSDPSVLDNQAIQLLNSSRDAFSRGDYTTATTLINQAIAKKPNDPVLHEFRALVLFATRQYRAATAAIYAVLSVGPGWDWATLISFYPNPDTYTAQLRALEKYRNENPKLPEARFLLAYHYMTCAHNDAAAVELNEVMKLNPKDQLAAQLLAGLSGDKQPAEPPDSGPALDAPPISAGALVGNWEATRPGDESIKLNIGEDHTYSWRYAQKGKSQEYSGVYTLADDMMILKRGGNATMIGQITMRDANHFNFKLVGSNSSDPGLTFTKTGALR